VNGSPATVAMQQVTRTVPMCRKYVRPCRCRPGLKPSPAGRQYHRICTAGIWHRGKWLELLKQIAPRVARVAVIATPR